MRLRNCGEQHPHFRDTLSYLTQTLRDYRHMEYDVNGEAIGYSGGGDEMTVAAATAFHLDDKKLEITSGRWH